MKSSKKGLKIGLIIIIVILVICLGILCLGIFKYQSNLKEKDQEYKSLEKLLENIKLKEDKIEYGTTWSYQELLNNLNIKDTKDVKVNVAINDLNIEKIEYQFKKLGDIKVNVILSKDYEYKLIKTYKETLMVNKELKVKVEDTKKPVINGVKDKEIMVSDKIDLKEGIEAIDDVDGKLEVKLEGDVDTSKAGTYEIKVMAEDLNGNKTEANFKVVVKEKPKETPKPSTSNNSSNKNSSSSNKNNSTTNNNSAPKTDKSTKEGRLYLAKEEAKKVVKNIIKPGMSDYEKAFQIFSYLHNNVQLQTNQSTEAYKTNFGNEAYAALVMKISACSGFCKAVTLLCNEAGLQSKHINQDQWAHQWNMVLIDGTWTVLDSQAGIFGGTTHPLEGW